MTRVQRERFDSEADYLRLKDCFILTPDKLRNAKSDLAILHPLPRVNEIAVAIDDDPRACYFKQVLNGKYMRMALILRLLGLTESKFEDAVQESAEESCAFVCKNPRCITTVEQELAQRFKLTDKANGVWRCAYCEAKANN
jgi:aspartate carbamoyltransferase catalytic subunit